MVEEEMRLVEEEYELGLLRIAHLGQLLEQLGQEPEQEGRVEARRVHELVGGKHVDIAAPIASRLHHVADIEGGLAEKMQRTLLLEHEQAALDRADRSFRDVAIFGRELGRALADIGDQRAQILEVEEQ